MPLQGVCWFLCCRQGFSLLGRDYGEKEEEESFELRNKEDLTLNGRVKTLHLHSRHKSCAWSSNCIHAVYYSVSFILQAWNVCCSLEGITLRKEGHLQLNDFSSVQAFRVTALEKNLLWSIAMDLHRNFPTRFLIFCSKVVSFVGCWNCLFSAEQICAAACGRFAWSCGLGQHWAIIHTRAHTYTHIDTNCKTQCFELILCAWPPFAQLQMRLQPCLLCNVSHLIGCWEFSIVHPLVRGHCCIELR